MVEVTVLSLPGCPNEPLLLARLTEVLADHPDVRVVRQLVQDEADAARLGMRASPTLLVNGVDLFATPGTPVSLSCRIYREETGHADGAPSVPALRRALQLPDRQAALPDPLGRTGLGRVAPVDGGLRAVHQLVLRRLAEFGQSPTTAEMDEVAAPFGADSRRVLAQLHAADFLRLDTSGAIREAYPFSVIPTGHIVEIEDGPQVFSMCAIDALGMAAMLDKTVTIHSAEPSTGAPITVTVPADEGRAAWNPSTAVVFTGQRSECGPCEPTSPARSSVPPIAADACCSYINFFTTQGAADAWAATHPEVTGQVLGQQDALRTGSQIFGPLLRTAP